MIAVLLVLLLLYGHFLYSSWQFNTEERTIALNKQQNSLIQVSIEPLNGSVHTGWFYEIPKANGGTQLITGNVYDILIDNFSQYEIADWYLTLNIRYPIYLNSAWAGTTTIRQNRDGEIIEQTLDLRQGFDQPIQLQHITGNDLLIPLKKGDSVTYHPSISAREMPIPPYSEKTGRVFTTIGFIFYTPTKSGTAPQINNGTFTYHLHKNITDTFEFWLLNMLLLIWGTIACIFLFSEKKLRELERKRSYDQAITNEIMTCFTGFIDAKDSYTAGHSSRVALYARRIAEEVGLNEDACRDVYYCGMLHDAGKIGVPDQIITKPGKLSCDEYSMIQEHTVDGYQILRSLTTLPHASEVARHHHERYNGSGYPDRLAGTAIPYYARIVCIADSFDAMSSERCYGKCSTKTEIIAELKNCSGTQFDPELAAVMIRLIEKGTFPFLT